MRGSQKTTKDEEFQDWIEYKKSNTFIDLFDQLNLDSEQVHVALINLYMVTESMQNFSHSFYKQLRTIIPDLLR